MKVTLIASTMVHHDAMAEWYEDTGADADVLATFAGRACYQSFHKPNPATREVGDYLAHILEQQHESVLEHSSVTFYLTGISRSLSHELVRHRHLSFSQLSQRYVDESNADLVIPPVVDGLGHQVVMPEGAGPGEEVCALCEVEGAKDEALRAYRVIVMSLEAQGFPRKRAREAARAVLPNATETRMVVTGNLRAWRDVLRKRWHVAADAEIRALAGEILRHLRVLAPASVQDIPDQPYGTKAAA